MFCMRYFPYQTWMDKLDQFRIEYNPDDHTLKDFLEKYQDKTIVIDVTNNFEDDDALIFFELSKEHKNFRVMIDYRNEEHLKRVQELKIPFFFINYISTIDEVNGLIKYHPTDMYICEELCFSLNRVSKLLHNNGIRVRVFPNICQSSHPDIPSIKKFFIRPDDIQIYSDYVDVFELFADLQRGETIYKVYNQKKWIGELKEIIPSFNDDLKNDHVLNVFAPLRIKCGKRCMYDPKSCSMCNLFLDLSKTMKEKGLVIRQVPLSYEEIEEFYDTDGDEEETDWNFDFDEEDDNEWDENDEQED